MVSAFSIGTAQRSTFQRANNHFVPGPGAYNANKQQIKQAPSYKIGTGQRKLKFKTSVPGPGAYNPIIKIDKKQPIWSFGLKNLADSSFMNNPGPGAYNPNIKVMVKAIPKYSIGNSQRDSATKIIQPGPGSYENKSTVIGIPGVRFSMADRDDLITENKTPGPGQYVKSRPSSAGPRYGFGTSKRINTSVQMKAPGPGQYDMSSTFQSDQKKGFSMTSRQLDQSLVEQSRLPGPGDYNPLKKYLFRPPTYKIGNQLRDFKIRDKTPGPGTYNSPDYEQYQISSQKIKIGSAIRRPLTDTSLLNPGPGSYNIPSSVGEGPKIKMLGQKIDYPKDIYLLPGPGSYHASVGQTKFRPQSAKIGTSCRNEISQQSLDAPGVGNYNIGGQKADGPSWGFGSMKRPALNETKETPGPGGYNIKPMFADVPKYLLPNK